MLDGIDRRDAAYESKTDDLDDDADEQPLLNATTGFVEREYERE